MRNVSIDKDPQRIGQMFDRIAPTYDLLNHVLSFGFDLWWRRQAVRALAIRSSQRILDVATGTGDLAFAALKEAPGCRVVGIDIAREMVSRARAKRDRSASAASRYIPMVADALGLPFADARFDAIMVAYGIRNMPDIGAACDQFHRVLKPGGRVLILEFSVPTVPVFRSLYLFYFNTILPAIGNNVSRDPEAYDYLPASVGAFIEPREMGRTLSAHGFQVEEIRTLLGGVTYFVSALKP